METNANQDLQHMRYALHLAHRGLGTTAPNPTVGCVIVKEGHRIAIGNTAPTGRPHAEKIALEHAGAAANGATLYVTLEPCCHQGQSGPCTDTIIAAGISRVVIATQDPNPSVAGQGRAQLEQAGIVVECGLLESEAKELNAGFFSVIQKQRPYVTLKLAISSDNKIADAHYHSKWITGEQSRAYAHLLRKQHDAIMVGSNTILHDDPALTCRLPGLESYSPIRIILDERKRVTKRHQVMQQPPETWVITERTRELDSLLETLANKGITRLLLEGGSQLAASFINQNLIDQIILIQSQNPLGEDGIQALEEKTIQQWQLEKAWKIKDDTVKLYKKEQANE